MLTEEEKLKLAHEPVALFSRSGDLIWRSPIWSKDPGRADAAVLGRKWQEFIFAEDLPLLLDWLAADGPEAINFRAMAPNNGETIRVFYRRVRCRENWLCLASVRPFPPLPPPSCVYLTGEEHLAD